ncbi:type IV conjugative transfer system lipoprotein TraV [Methylomonas sp. AM2-LC]|uniref:type IV conjugative transfer system lipoprotein TraV n=1 Tax=Methylomonas sp. AM2-LC TaxID=3153301 RepID=UPI003262E1B2
MSHRIDYRIPVVLISILASGCATTEYGCKGMPEDPKCLSTTEAYQLSDKALPDPTKTSEVNVAGVNAQTDSAASLSSLPPTPILQQPVPKIDDPTPIRTPAQVMRIWIAPWEDAEGDLMVSNYVYTEIEPRRWMIGKSAPTISPSLVPLQVEQRPPEKARDLDNSQTDTELRTLPQGGRKTTDNN